MATTATRVVTILAEPLSRRAFAPFGEVISDVDIEPFQTGNFYRDGSKLYRTAFFESDQPVEFLLRRSQVRPFRVLYLERHLELTQTFIPLGGDAFISVVAAPDAREAGGFPAMDEIHAFIVPGDQAINIHRGTWHEPPFPLVDRSQQIVLSHRALTLGLQEQLNDHQEVAKLDVEKRNCSERTGIELRVAYAV